MLKFAEFMGSLDEMFTVIDLTLIPDELVENALSGLPSHMTKDMTNKYGDTVAGENSNVSKTHIKSHSGLVSTIDSALAKGNHVVVHKDGKPVAHIFSKGANLGMRPKYEVNHADGSKHSINTQMQFRGTGVHVGSGANRHYVPPQYHTRTETEHTKGDAIAHTANVVHGGGNPKETFHVHNVEVHEISSDAHRAGVMQDRAKEASKPDGLKANTDAAAHKLAVKVAGSGSSPHDEAKKLHDELGKHIADGNDRAARQAAEHLAQHISRHGTSKTSAAVDSVEDAYKQIKAGWGKASAKETIAKAKADANKP